MFAPAKLPIVQSGQKVLSIPEIKQDAAFLPELFGHVFEGTVQVNLLRIEMSDRNCANVAPDKAISMPRWKDLWERGGTKVFKAHFALDGKGFSGDRRPFSPESTSRNTY